MSKHWNWILVPETNGRREYFAFLQSKEIPGRLVKTSAFTFATQYLSLAATFMPEQSSAKLNTENRTGKRSDAKKIKFSWCWLTPVQWVSVNRAD